MRFLPTLVVAIWLCIYPNTALTQSIANNAKKFIALQDSLFAITNITLIDGSGAASAKGMTVLVASGKILSVTSSKNAVIPKNAVIIDGAGKTLLPGFVMLHEHIFYSKVFEDRFNVENLTNTFPRMYLAGGVTTMRTAGSIMPYTDLNIHRLITKGKMIGPKMDVTAPFIEREGLDIPQLPILPKGQSAGAMVDYWADMGCTSFKVYNFLTKDDLREVVKKAHAKGMKVTGHLCSITYQEAAEIGIDNLEHGFTQASDFIPNKVENACDPFERNKSLLSMDKDDARMQNLMKLLIEKNVTITYTPAVFAPSTGYEIILGGGDSALVPKIFENVKSSYTRRLNNDSSAQKLFSRDAYWTKKFYDMGGKITIGTDPTGAGRTIAGYANMWTVEALVKAGFSLEQTIMLCTLKGAEYLGREKEIGTITKGKAADLILIDGDVTANVGLIRKIQTVFKDGVGYDSRALFESVKGQVGLY